MPLSLLWELTDRGTVPSESKRGDRRGQVETQTLASAVFLGTGILPRSNGCQGHSMPQAKALSAGGIQHHFRCVFSVWRPALG